MKTSEIFRLQEQAASQNIMLFSDGFRWCDHAIELMIDAHEFLANDSDVLALRKEMSVKDTTAYEAMNVVVNLAYDALGTLISARRLLAYGVLADAWSLIRGAFESSCSAEYFLHADHKVKDYLVIAERLKGNRSADVRRELNQANLQIAKVLQFLQSRDDQNRVDFYGRLSNFGTHASPVRSGLRIRVSEPDVRVYLAIGHRESPQCLADLAATAKYAMGIPFEAWPELMARKAPLVARHTELEKEYATVFMS